MQALKDFESVKLQVFGVVKDWEKLTGFSLWPGDSLDRKMETVELYFQSQLYSLALSPSGKVQGFLFFYRNDRAAGLNENRVYCAGRFVVCDVLYCVPGFDARRLIAKAIHEHWNRIAGAEKLIFQRGAISDRTREYDFSRFLRRVEKWDQKSNR